MEQQRKPERELTRDERAELRTERAIRHMLNTDGWKVYRTILEMHLQGKRNEFEEPAELKLDGISQILRAESAKGAIMGLRLALSIPDGIIQSAKILRERIGMREDEDEE